MMMNRNPFPSAVRQISTHAVSASSRRVINHATGCALLIFAILFAAPQQSPAQQCEPQWSDEWSKGDPFEAVNAMTVFDDGTGPALYVCDYNSLWKWDGSDWTQLCRGGGDFFYSLAVHDDGSGAALYLGGSFRTILGSGAQIIEANNIVRWDGASWSALGDGVGSVAANITRVKSLQSFDDGSGPSLYVGGWFDTAGTVHAQNVASWDGQQWRPLGRGVVRSGFEPVLSMAVFDDGSGNALYVGGDFTQAGSLQTNSIARWEGDVWSNVGGGLFEEGDEVRAMTVFDDGDGPVLVVGGDLSGNLRSHMSKWDGRAWTEMLGVNKRVTSLHVQSEGGNETLYIGGFFTWIGDPSNGEAASGIGAYDGKSWFSVAQGVSGTSVSKGKVQSVISFDDGSGPAIIAGGTFSLASGAVVSNIAKWNQIEWAPLSEARSQIVGIPDALVTLDDGNGQALYVGGIHYAGAVELGGVGKFDGENWTPLGTPIQYGTIYDFEIYDGGAGSRLFAAGKGSLLAKNTLIASYNGTTWDSYPQARFTGGGISPQINAMTVFDDGSGPALYVGGEFEKINAVVMNNLAKWDGTSWSPLSDGNHIGVPGEVNELLIFDDGSGPALFPVGRFDESWGSVSTGIAKWDASGWTPVPGLPVFGYSATIFDDGAGSKIYVADRRDVFRWDGTWNSVSPSTSSIYRLRAFDDGSGAHLYVIGAFRPTVPNPFNNTGILKLVNGQWDPALEPLDHFAYNLEVFNGSLYVAGLFTQAGEIQTGHLARLIGCPPTCKADCDQSTGVGVLDIFDFLCFQNSFVLGEPYACDCDTSTGAGVCDIIDFLCFQNAFVAGCP